MNDFYVYKIMSEEDWKQSKHKVFLKLLHLDINFIHLCEDHQISNIIEKFWKNVNSVIVVKIDPSKTHGNLIKEKNPGGSTEYYHLYNGSISLEAIVKSNVIKIK